MNNLEIVTVAQFALCGVLNDFLNIIYVKIMFQCRDVAQEPESHHGGPGSIPRYMKFGMKWK